MALGVPATVLIAITSGLIFFMIAFVLVTLSLWRRHNRKLKDLENQLLRSGQRRTPSPRKKSAIVHMTKVQTEVDTSNDRVELGKPHPTSCERIFGIPLQKHQRELPGAQRSPGDTRRDESVGTINSRTVVAEEQDPTAETHKVHVIDEENHDVNAFRVTEVVSKADTWAKSQLQGKKLVRTTNICRLDRSASVSGIPSVRSHGGVVSDSVDTGRRSRSMSFAGIGDCPSRPAPPLPSQCDAMATGTVQRDSCSSSWTQDSICNYEVLEGTIDEAPSRYPSIGSSASSSRTAPEFASPSPARPRHSNRSPNRAKALDGEFSIHEDDTSTGSRFGHSLQDDAQVFGSSSMRTLDFNTRGTRMPFHLRFPPPKVQSRRQFPQPSIPSVGNATDPVSQKRVATDSEDTDISGKINDTKFEPSIPLHHPGAGHCAGSNQNTEPCPDTALDHGAEAKSSLQNGSGSNSYTSEMTRKQESAGDSIPGLTLVKSTKHSLSKGQVAMSASSHCQADISQAPDLESGSRSNAPAVQTLEPRVSIRCVNPLKPTRTRAATMGPRAPPERLVRLSRGLGSTPHTCKTIAVSPNQTPGDDDNRGDRSARDFGINDASEDKENVNESSPNRSPDSRDTLTTPRKEKRSKRVAWGGVQYRENSPRPESGESASPVSLYDEHGFYMGGGTPT